jgi:DNA (cytosine-5)-methyltransferase 1
MKLWQEILFLKGYFKGDWVVENVKTWYDPFIRPQESAMHYFWSNFDIPKIDIKTRCHDGTVEELQNHKGFNLENHEFSNKSKEKVLRNCVHPKIGEKILEVCGKTTQQNLTQIG